MDQCLYMFVCACVFGEPQGPNLMSYLCAFLTRAQRSAHGTVIPGHGWPCWAARLCRLLYLWHHHHHHHALCLYVCLWVCIYTSVCIPGGQECTREANTVYISIMNQVREKQWEQERRGKERGWNGGRDGESHFPSAIFIPLSVTNPCGASSFCICLFPFISLHFALCPSFRGLISINTKNSGKCQ